MSTIENYKKNSVGQGTARELFKKTVRQGTALETIFQRKSRRKMPQLEPAIVIEVVKGNVLGTKRLLVLEVVAIELFVVVV